MSKRAMWNTADWHAQDSETVRKWKELVRSGNRKPLTGTSFSSPPEFA